MPPAEKDVVNAPNHDGAFRTDGRANSNGPLTSVRPPETPPNLSRLLHGDPGGSADLARQPSPVRPPNLDKFRAGDRGYTDENSPAAVEPGRAAVPVNPFVGTASLLGQPPAATLRSK
ncbi:MAG: hypothetical protein ACYDCI_00160 [Candidatus Limnocylindrales bacterium]